MTLGHPEFYGTADGENFLRAGNLSRAARWGRSLGEAEPLQLLAVMLTSGCRWDLSLPGGRGAEPLPQAQSTAAQRNPAGTEGKPEINHGSALFARPSRSPRPPPPGARPLPTAAAPEPPRREPQPGGERRLGPARPLVSPPGLSSAAAPGAQPAPPGLPRIPLSLHLPGSGTWSSPRPPPAGPGAPGPRSPLPEPGKPRPLPGLAVPLCCRRRRRNCALCKGHI